MNLRELNYPPKYWFQLHNHSINLLSPPTSKKRRIPSKNKINNCIISLAPHIQKFIYTGATDKRKGEIRSTKFPLSPEQFLAMKHLGLSRKYEYVISLERQLQLEYKFIHKGYIRGIENIQFRLQQQKPVIPRQKPVLLLRIRFHQKAPVLHE